jgi:hypothetical protein
VQGDGTVHGLLVVGRTRPLAQPIALAGHLPDGRVREEAIEDRSRGRDIAEEDAPVLRLSLLFGLFRPSSSVFAYGRPKRKPERSAPFPRQLPERWAPSVQRQSRFES